MHANNPRLTGLLLLLLPFQCLALVAQSRGRSVTLPRRSVSLCINKRTGGRGDHAWRGCTVILPLRIFFDRFLLLLLCFFFTVTSGNAPAQAIIPSMSAVRS